MFSFDTAQDIIDVTLLGPDRDIQILTPETEEISNNDTETSTQSNESPENEGMAEGNADNPDKSGNDSTTEELGNDATPNDKGNEEATDESVNVGNEGIENGGNDELTEANDDINRGETGEERGFTEEMEGNTVDEGGGRATTRGGEAVTEGGTPAGGVDEAMVGNDVIDEFESSGGAEGEIEEGVDIANIEGSEVITDGVTPEGGEAEVIEGGEESSGEKEIMIDTGTEITQLAVELGTEMSDIDNTEGIIADLNNTVGNNTDNTDSNDGENLNNITTAIMTTITAKPTTVKKIFCGRNSFPEDGVCVCHSGWIRNPFVSSTSSTGCLCPDLCNGTDALRCPSGAQCYHISCNMASCRCPEKMYFNTVARRCQDPCAYYGDSLCGLVSNRACEVSQSAEEGFTCPCAPGYTETGDTCVDENECLTSSPCGSEEECVNTVGSYTCHCNPGYMRSETGTCTNINECLNPGLHDCKHLCEDTTPGYTCQCYDGYTWNDELRICELDDELTRCLCDDPPRSICYQPSDGPRQCYPKAGYIRVNDSFEDQLECSENVDQWCHIRGQCQEGIGSSVCQCQTGYVNNTVNYGECEEIQCPPGTVLSGSNCVDPCNLLRCPPPLSCTVGSRGTGECVCGARCQGLLDPNIDTSVYYGSLVVVTPSGGEDTAWRVTEMLKTYFGQNRVEIVDTETRKVKRRMKRNTEALKNLRVEFVVVTEQPNMNEEVEQIIQSQCQNSANVPSGTCVMPGGLVVQEDSINVENRDPCMGNPCPGVLFQCSRRKNVTGRYNCNCIKGYNKFEVKGTPGYCKGM
ncbi:hypothetical protein SK128_021689 [Halocaridina rubra]|uniref:EGF-like domain-containing protein n=1 Tax=Halocaridina rubra TaxID=373956 RepID=A0AAN8ZX70_HALRR